MTQYSKEKVSRKAEEIDDAWVDEMVRQTEVEASSLVSIYVADRLEEDGHAVPNIDAVYNISDKGVETFSVEAFAAWAESVSGERFISLNQGKDPYIYKNGVYIPHVEGWLKAVMNACNKNAGLTLHYVKEVVARLGANRMMNEGMFDMQDPNITVLGNCALNTLTGECQDYDPDHVAFSKLSVNHVQGARCPIWDDFLEYTLEPEDRISLQELFGYCLVRGYPYHAAWFMLGSGQNGKGASMNILRAMLGKHNCSAVALQEVNERFYSYDLYGKYANISGDTSPRALCDASMYKMLTGGDEIRVEQKGKDAFDFVSHAKIISSMNELMKSDDQSDGFFRRFVLIRFGKTIPIKRIREKEGFEQEIIKNEMPGVLNWAIKGLKRVREQGGFSWQLGKSKDDLRKIWNREADPLQGFIDDCCEVGPKRIVASEVFMWSYGLWHEGKYGTPPVEDQSMVSKSKVRYGFGASPRTPRAGDRDLWRTDGGAERDSIRCYTGICLRNTAGDLSVDVNYISEHWTDICNEVGEAKGLNTMTSEEIVESMIDIDTPPITPERGSEIWDLIEDRVKAYGGNTSDHAMGVIESWIEVRGFNMTDIKYYVQRYKEGHRMFVPRIMEA